MKTTCMQCGNEVEMSIHEEFYNTFGTMEYDQHPEKLQLKNHQYAEKLLLTEPDLSTLYIWDIEVCIWHLNNWLCGTLYDPDRTEPYIAQMIWEKQTELFRLQAEWLRRKVEWREKNG